VRAGLLAKRPPKPLKAFNKKGRDPLDRGLLFVTD